MGVNIMAVALLTSFMLTLLEMRCYVFFQVEKAFREGTARQNAHSLFVSLALKLLEERVHVACKEIVTLEKQVFFALLYLAILGISITN